MANYGGVVAVNLPCLHWDETAFGVNIPPKHPSFAAFRGSDAQRLYLLRTLWLGFRSYDSKVQVLTHS